MNKKTGIALVITIAISIFLLWLWYFLKFNYVDNPLDLLLSIIWWVVIGVGVVLVSYAEYKRRQAMRTMFVGNKTLYNPENGVVACTEQQLLALAEETLTNMKYPLSVAACTQDTQKETQFVVHTRKFDQEKDTWSGYIETAGGKMFSFENRNELADLVALYPKGDYAMARYVSSCAIPSCPVQVLRPRPETSCA